MKLSNFYDQEDSKNFAVLTHFTLGLLWLVFESLTTSSHVGPEMFGS